MPDRPNIALTRLRLEPARSNVVLIAMPILIILFTYFGSNDFYRTTLTTAETYNDLHGYMYHHAGAFVIMGIGSLLVGLVLGFSLREMGLGLGDLRSGLRITLPALAAVVVVSFLGSRSPEVMQEYPLAKRALEGPNLLALHLAFYLLYYAGWEFLFRGFSLFGLLQRFGKWGAILVQMIPSAVIHTSIVSAGKPFAESIGAVPFGIAMGWLTVKTGSIWYAFAIHALLGMMTDVWLYIHAL